MACSPTEDNPFGGSPTEDTIKHIKELIKQINSADDCEALALMVEAHIKSTQDLIVDIIEENRKILSDLLPVLDLPFPDPISITKWIEKLMTSTAMQQLKATINYIKQLIDLAMLLMELVEAITNAADKILACAANLPGYAASLILGTINNEISTIISDAENSVNNEIDKILEDTCLKGIFIAPSITLLLLNGEITTSLGELSMAQSKITNIVGTSDTMIDTTNQETFMSTVDSGFDSLNSSVSTYIAQTNTSIQYVTFLMVSEF